MYYVSQEIPTKKQRLQRMTLSVIRVMRGACFKGII